MGDSEPRASARGASAEGAGPRDRRVEFEGLVRAHSDWLHRYLAGLLGSVQDAEDCAQEVFFRAWCALSRLDLPNRAAQRALLRTIAMRVAYNAVRARRTQKRTVPKAEQVAPLVEAVEGGERNAGAIAHGVLDVLSSLPHIHREVLVLRYFEELSIAEVAALLGLSESAVKMRLKRAREALRDAVEEARDDSG